MRKARIIAGIMLSFIAVVSGGMITVAATREDTVRVTEAAGYQVDPQHAPKSSIVIDAQEGRVLWEQDLDLVRNPASMTKMMALYLVFDAIAEGKFDLDTKVTATAEDQQMSELYAISNSKIAAGVAYPVRDLLKMVVVPSSNAATVMLANLVSENDGAAFIQAMNRKADELGMESSQFYNCSGASIAAFEGLYQVKGIDPDAVNKTTARDLALMVFHLLEDHPEILEFTKDPRVTVMAGTPYEETFDTYNYSLPGAAHGLEGVDGLKTGSGPDAAFNVLGAFGVRIWRGERREPVVKKRFNQLILGLLVGGAVLGIAGFLVTLVTVVGSVV